MTVGLYFGSFNPVHNGHLIIASFVANYTDLQRVWFIVSPQNPFKEQRSLLNENHRKHLIDLAIEGEKKLRTSSIEFNLPKPSYTVETLQYLHEKYPDHKFSIIVGSDSFLNIKRWKRGDYLLETYPFIVYERPGFKVNRLKQNENITVLKAPLLEISSTQIREMIQQNKSIRYLVPDIVREEIESQLYYR